jgi:hypothetical protein
MQSTQPRLDVDDPLLDGLLILCKLHGCPASRASLCSGLPWPSNAWGWRCCRALPPVPDYRRACCSARWTPSRRSTCPCC